MHTVFALLCFVVVIHWLIFLYPSGLLHWHCGNLTIAPVPAKQPWWIWINTSCEFIMNDWVTTTKQSTTKPCAYLLGYTVYSLLWFCSVWAMCLDCRLLSLLGCPGNHEWNGRQQWFSWVAGWRHDNLLTLHRWFPMQRKFNYRNTSNIRVPP